MYKNPRHMFESEAYGGVLTINLASIIHNYLVVAEKTKPACCAAVVKANAYGLGASKVAPALYEAGCRLFFVAQLIEAHRLRPFLPPDAEIAILNDIAPGMEDIVADNGFWPVLNSLDSIEAWGKVCLKRGLKLSCIVQVDSGMSRLGLDRDELTFLAADYKIFNQADVRYIISHLSCADDPQNPHNLAQETRFRDILKILPPCPAALANSGGIFLEKRLTDAFAMVRPGLALYGVDPHDNPQTPLRQVVSLSARVAQIRHVQAGDRVGYGAAYQARYDMVIATLAVGYADGLHRTLGGQGNDGKGAVFYQGIRLPIIGRISMDSITVDITTLPKGKLRRGELVEIIGKHQSISELACAAGTIAYEILTSLGARYERRYIGWEV